MVSWVVPAFVVAFAPGEGLPGYPETYQDAAVNTLNTRSERSLPSDSTSAGLARGLRTAGNPKASKLAAASPHGGVAAALRRVVGAARRSRLAAQPALWLSGSKASDALEAEFGSLLQSSEAGSFCNRQASFEASKQTQADASPGSICITVDPYERAVSEYKRLVSQQQLLGLHDTLRTGLYSQPVCSDAGLNNFVQTAVDAWQKGKKLLPDCHFSPQSELIWRRSGESVCQHQIKEQNLLASLRELRRSSEQPLKLEVDFRDTSDSRICPSLSAESLTLPTRRLLDAVYEEDFDRLNYQRSQRSLVFVPIPRNLGAGVVEATSESQVVWPSRMATFQERVRMQDGSVCSKHQIPPRYLSGTDAQVYGQADSMCVVKHPFERAVSEYIRLLEDGKRGKLLSESYGIALRQDPPCSAQGLNHFLTSTMRVMQEGRQFALNCHMIPQSEYIWGDGDKQWCQNVLRAEDLPGALDILMEKKGYPHMQLGQWPTTSRMCQNLTAKALSGEVKELLYQVYSEDFKRLGYLRPMQLTAARMEAEVVRKEQKAQLPTTSESQVPRKQQEAQLPTTPEPQVLSPGEDVHRSFLEGVPSMVPKLAQQPSMFVAVFSRRSGGKRRHFVRSLWADIQRRSSGNVTFRFVLCRAPGDGVWPRLFAENKTYGDLKVLPCGEGYDQGLLTEKVLASMWAYKEEFFDREFFMKIDDDAFLSWQKYSHFLDTHGTPLSYIGVPIGQSIPCRNSSYRWYEPYETFPQALFPRSMAGGAGYVLGKRLVQEILESGVGEANVLYNEDRAVGVWVSKLAQDGLQVLYQNILGIDGWWGWDWKNPLQNWQRWGDYPYLVHHGLHATTISCLARMDSAGRMDGDISRCFLNEVGITHEPLKCAEETAQKLVPQ